MLYCCGMCVAVYCCGLVCDGVYVSCVHIVCVCAGISIRLHSMSQVVGGSAKHVVLFSGGVRE